MILGMHVKTKNLSGYWVAAVEILASVANSKPLPSTRTSYFSSVVPAVGKFPMVRAPGFFRVRAGTLDPVSTSVLPSPARPSPTLPQEFLVIQCQPRSLRAKATSSVRRAVQIIMSASALIALPVATLAADVEGGEGVMVPPPEVNAGRYGDFRD
jgi:hypothetical protein